MQTAPAHGRDDSHPAAVDGHVARAGWAGGVRTGLLGAMLLGVLAGCAGPGSGFLPGEDGAPHAPVDVSHIPNAVPRVEPRSASGNPDSYVVAGRRYYVMRSSRGYVARGIASWYGTKFHGRKTSSGEPYNMYAMTAAHKTLPLPTYVEVTNLRNGRHVIVRVNDRGPFHANRLIDLSYAAAKKLGVIATGTAPVEVRAIDPRAWQRARLYPATSRPPAHTPRPPQPVATTPAPVPVPVPAPAYPATTPVPPASPAGVYLQVGAFSERDNAEQLRNRLIATFHSVHISRGTSGHGPVYRVRIGPVHSAEDLAQKANALRSIGMHYDPVTID